MAQERPNRLVQWYNLAREHTPAVREQLAGWWEAVREEPRLAWETTAVRCVVYGVGGLLTVWVATTLVRSMTPPPPASARAAATTADFHVVCTQTECGHHFVIHREFGFDAFPIACPACKRETGAAARKCNSATCAGRWVAPTDSPSGRRCPHCGADLGP